MDLYRRLAKLDRVLVIAQTSRTQMPVLVPTGQVLSHMLSVIATDDYDRLAFHSSEFQFLWTAKYSAGLKADLRFFPSDCFENLAQVPQSSQLISLGEELHSFRSSVMNRRELGLTALYNLMHDPTAEDDDIVRLRSIHLAINTATLEAYALGEEREPAIRAFEAQVASEQLPRWRDIELEHGFHKTRQGVRLTISPQARDVVLDKLLALNHYRYRQEVEQGLHGTRRGQKAVSALGEQQIEVVSGAPVDGEEAAAVESPFEDDGLFAPPDALF